MNRTLTENPEYLNWLPEGAQVQGGLQSSVDSLYLYGRGFLGDMVSHRNVSVYIQQFIVTIFVKIHNQTLMDAHQNDPIKKVFKFEWALIDWLIDFGWICM